MSAQGARAPFPLLVATALVCGAMVMVIEVLGSRVIGPFFGVSLFVWTSLITVTLLALAAGYAVGGIVSDRRGTPDVLYGTILLAGLLVLTIPWLRGPVLRASVPLGLRAGAFTASAALFGPALFLLGCVSPLLVKIAAHEMREIGRTVGSLYAISTLGSFAGTVLTGFVLIATFGVSRIFQVVGAVLLTLAVTWFVVFRRRYAAAVVLALAFVAPGRGSIAGQTSDGTRVTQVAHEESYYGDIRIVDYQGTSLHTREMLIDGLTQSGIDLATGLSIYEYTYGLQLIPYAIQPQGTTCLVIGSGAGAVPTWFERQGIRTDVVDIDPAIVRLAQRWFGLRVSGDIVIDDARHFLTTTSRTYDYAILDVFNGDTTPGHVLSREALELLRARMRPGGVVAANVIGSLGADRYMTASIVRTFEAVFPSVTVHPRVDPAAGPDLLNIIVVASMSASARPEPDRVRAHPIHPLARTRREDLFETFQFPANEPAIVLSDDYNPIDVFDRAVKERLRHAIVATTDWNLLL